jgi:hypothetical protein
MAIRRPREESPNANPSDRAPVKKISSLAWTTRAFASPPATDFPPIMSDDEFAAQLEDRKRHEREEYNRWNPAAREPAPSDGLPESTLEQSFPHIAKKICAVWPSDACAEYIKSLLVVERESRRGFPPLVVEDLLMLDAMNEMLLRKISLTPYDVWGATPKPR